MTLFVFHLTLAYLRKKTQPIPVEKLVKCKMQYAFFSQNATLYFFTCITFIN